MGHQAIEREKKKKGKNAREGTLPMEGGTEMCRGHDPLFPGQSTLPSLPIYHQCAAHVPPFQLSRCKFSKFSLPRLLIFQGKPAP